MHKSVLVVWPISPSPVVSVVLTPRGVECSCLRLLVSKTSRGNNNKLTPLVEWLSTRKKYALVQSGTPLVDLDTFHLISICARQKVGIMNPKHVHFPIPLKRSKRSRSFVWKLLATNTTPFRKQEPAVDEKIDSHHGTLHWKSPLGKPSYYCCGGGAWAMPALYAEFVNLDTAVVTTPPKINESNLKPWWFGSDDFRLPRGCTYSQNTSR